MERTLSMRAQLAFGSKLLCGVGFSTHPDSLLSTPFVHNAKNDLARKVKSGQNVLLLKNPKLKKEISEFFRLNLYIFTIHLLIIFHLKPTPLYL